MSDDETEHRWTKRENCSSHAPVVGDGVDICTALQQRAECVGMAQRGCYVQGPSPCSVTRQHIRAVQQKLFDHLEEREISNEDRKWIKTLRNSKHDQTRPERQRGVTLPRCGRLPPPRAEPYDRPAWQHQRQPSERPGAWRTRSRHSRPPPECDDEKERQREGER
jgi:hypothetical protein